MLQLISAENAAMFRHCWRYCTAAHATATRLHSRNWKSSIMATSPSASLSPNSALNSPLATPALKRAGKRGSVFFLKDRNTWAYEYKTPEGKLKRTSHPTAEAAGVYCKQREAELVAAYELSLDETRTRRYLSGPEGVTLAQMMAEYAVTFTIRKGGASQELSTINRFLRAGFLPVLRVVKGDQGAVTIEKRHRPQVLPQAFTDRLEAVHARQPRTTAKVRFLANLPIRGVGVHHVQSLMLAMADDGLTDSTRQKHYALIRHAFTTAMDSWDWQGLINPCKGEKFPDIGYKHVVVTDPQIVMLRNALAECGQPAYAVGPANFNLGNSTA